MLSTQPVLGCAGNTEYVERYEMAIEPGTPFPKVYCTNTKHIECLIVQLQASHVAKHSVI